MKNTHTHRIKNLLRTIVYSVSTIIIAAILFLIFTFFKTDLRDEIPFQSLFQKNYQIFALDIPAEIEFAGEKVPVEHFDVYESFDRELLINTYWQSQTLLFIKRAHRFFPVIEPILKANNIPDDFKYLALAESGLTNSISPAGAVGFWQFLSGTAKDYGLVVNDEVDERYHLEKSTEAACKFLQESYNTYDNWTMAAASYNAGRRGINNQVFIQKETDYYDLLLNEETARYLFRILAIKAILENPEEYGFLYRKQDLYQPLGYYEVKLDSTIDDFAEFAKTFGTNYKLLKFHNPWLRKPFLNNRNKKVYTIKIPMENSRIRQKKDVEDPQTIGN
jgi:hypothetical protein